ncbi:hypothetical protein [Methylobacterium durans]|uniref:hypothetical protein n=1 Tax=Methylobacterium durans TaxID=2202825 RepID=UPI0013A53D51|nr:hypothetical protein [Methylobacterium durans]
MTDLSAALGPIGIVDVAPRLAAVVRQRVGYAEMGRAQRHARSLLEAALRDAGVAPDGPPLTVWRPLDGGLVDYAPACSSRVRSRRRARSACSRCRPVGRRT